MFLMNRNNFVISQSAYLNFANSYSCGPAHDSCTYVSNIKASKMGIKVRVSEAAALRCSVKKDVLKFLQNSLESTSA